MSNPPYPPPLPGPMNTPPEPAEWLRLRALGVLNNLVGMVALGRRAGLTPEQCARFVVEQYRDHGFHDGWRTLHGTGNAAQFAEIFAAGRRMLYDEVIVSAAEGGLLVRSRAWYHDPQPEVFFFMDVELPELDRFSVEVMRVHAEELAIELDIRRSGEWEVALIRPRKEP